MANFEDLKPFNKITEMDPRNGSNVRYSYEKEEFEPATLNSHYADIESFSLSDSVPDDIKTQFNVARNLYLYAWYEYRFYNVAESKALTVLEFALKMRICEQPIKEYIRRRKKEHKIKTGKNLNIQRGLKILIEYARENKLIENKGFAAWHRVGKQLAFNKALSEQRNWMIQELEKQNVDEISVPVIEFNTMIPDPNFDYVEKITENIPVLRNEYSHGSKMLYKDVLDTFEMVSDFINQIYVSKNAKSNNSVR